MVVLFILIVFAFWLFLRVGDLQNEIKRQDEGRPKPNIVGELDLEQLKEDLSLIDAPLTWTTNVNHRIFIAPPMKLLDPNDLFPKLYSQGVADRERNKDGIPFGWLRIYHLPTTTSVANLDPDRDGFTIMEEYRAGTDPNNPASKPDVALKLRIEGSAYRKQFPLIFTGVNEGALGRTFLLNRRDGSNTYRVAKGDTIPDAKVVGWKVVDYLEKSEDQKDHTIKGSDGKPLIRKVDVSELILQKKEESPLILIKQKPAWTEDLFVKLQFLIDHSTREVTQGMIFPLQEAQYQVVAINKIDDGSTNVIIKRIDSGKEFKVLPLTEEDLKKNQTTTSNLPAN